MDDSENLGGQNDAVTTRVSGRVARSQSSVALGLADDRPISDCGSLVANTIESNQTSVASRQASPNDWSKLVTSASNRSHQKYYGMVANESILHGFMLLKLMQQFLNPDVDYIGLDKTKSLNERSATNQTESREKLTPNEEEIANDIEANGRGSGGFIKSSGDTNGHDDQDDDDDKTIMDEVAEMNPFYGLLRRSSIFRSIFRCIRICLSLIAILISVDKTLSTILLCLLSKLDSKHQGGSAKDTIEVNFEASDVSMSWFVLVLVNMSSTYILFSLVFNGHLLWNLLSQRLFLVSRRFQYKTMLSLLIFAYLEYIINISFINNLFGWSFVIKDIEGQNLRLDPDSNIHGGYSILNNLRTFVTEQDEKHHYVDILLTIVQFSRGVIRIGPYITINYVIICLKEHIKTIRNQYLLTDSLKKRQKLRLVVKKRRSFRNGGPLGLDKLSSQIISTGTNGNISNNMAAGSGGNNQLNRKKRVIFVTEASGASGPLAEIVPSNGLDPDPLALRQIQLSSPSSLQSGSSCQYRQSPSPLSLGARSASSLSASKVSRLLNTMTDEMADETSDPSRAKYPMDSMGRFTGVPNGGKQMGERKMMIMRNRDKRKINSKTMFLDRVQDFDELESYITNLYIFTGRLNRLMSRQGLPIFFIVHNLIISCSLIVPEAIRGGQPMVYVIRLLVILIGIVPFICGQSLNGQLEQLSKQIDRIIIQQQFISRRRDNLVRIRELLHDIRINCGGMLNFNVEAGIKYLVVAFASAFFIEQEDYKLTRRH